jgi:hypothetical protein
MNIYGIDFTSTPKRNKPITCLECRLEGNRLEAVELIEWRDFEGIEVALRRTGPWIAGIDFPFGQSRKFIENIGWPDTWQGYVAHVGSLGRKGFCSVLDGYRPNRPAGDKEHRRTTDTKAGSISPQKLYGTPVGLMFFEGAPRLLKAGVTIPRLQQGDPQRIVVEAYPGVLGRVCADDRASLRHAGVAGGRCHGHAVRVRRAGRTGADATRSRSVQRTPVRVSGTTW